MFIGEAPGKDEDEKGEPFVGNAIGQAGSILNEWLGRIGVPRAKVYITNIVKCRPTKIVDGRPPSNRAPTTEEIASCADWLNEEVGLVKPILIVPLGVPATSRVLGRKVLMSEVHGKLLPGQESIWRNPTITIIPTYHPTGIRGDTQKLQAVHGDLDTIRSVYSSLRT